jgi:hypothetical protein
VNSTKYEPPVQNTKVLGYIATGILVVFLVVVIFRGIATFDGQSHPGLDYVFFVGLIFGLVFFATLAVKFLFIGDDKD